jgi:hypothetical protein
MAPQLSQIWSDPWTSVIRLGFWTEVPHFAPERLDAPGDQKHPDKGQRHKCPEAADLIPSFLSSLSRLNTLTPKITITPCS